MKFSDYAKSIGKTRGYIHKLYVQGRLDKAIYSDKGKKRINKEIADAILKGLSDKNLYTKPETNSDGKYTNRYTNKNNAILSKNFTQNTKKTSSQMSEKIFEQTTCIFDPNSNFDSNSEFESMTYDQARRMKVYYEAQLEKFHLEKEKGKYLLAEDVKKNAYKAGLIFRDKVLSVPAQVSSILSEMTSAFEIKNLLHEYLTTAIEDACNAKNQSTEAEINIEAAA
ncbi:MAG: hypothetical protein V4591_01595 [Bdellovibrionota bacterium]